ncbi:MAG: polysaccharide deacetylase family protein [Bryobacteraceae bacterium]|nr:polysaccharide deacetylase family protein [Bryobacteraceae bacterium]
MRTIALLVLGACGAWGQKFLGVTKYLNGARAAVTHTIDDSTNFVAGCVDAMDRYGIKATIFISTEREPVSKLWPRMQQAINDGHEIGSHSRRHQCKWPDDEAFCGAAYSDYEISGSRDDILAKTNQPYVWSWCYPCGNCAGNQGVHKKLAAAGFLLARNYPDEANDGHVVPNMNGWAANPFNAAYTQVVQKKGGIAKSGNTDVAKLNAKFDEIYASGGIYNFLSHPQWLDYGAEAFYEKHLAYIGKRADVWYVPMGPLYMYKTLREQTEVKKGRGSRFAVSNKLDPKIYNGSVTLEFTGAGKKRPRVNGAALEEKTGVTDRWTGEYFRREGERVLVTVRPGVTVEFR